MIYKKKIILVTLRPIISHVEGMRIELYKKYETAINSIIESCSNLSNNEQLEFLGDRVLGLVLSKKLMNLYPNESEGMLDKKFASLVNRKTCLKISKVLELEKFLRILTKLFS